MMVTPKMKLIEEEAVQALIARAFVEDIRSGDITSRAIVEENSRARAVWKSKEKGVVAGLEVAHAVFEQLDPDIKWYPTVNEGDRIDPGTEMVKIEGRCRAMLTAERIALNFVQRMSGIATKTSQFVEAIGDLNTRILDTRKTVPGLRILDKYAVGAGGGMNHRMGLFDLAMIKDNHIVAADGITRAVANVREQDPDIRIEVETTSLEEVEEALSAGTDIIMLDNMSLSSMEQAVAFIDGRAEVEASGNISLETVREVAETGVNFISVGALTHSVTAFDISQQLLKIYK